MITKLQSQYIKPQIDLSYVEKHDCHLGYALMFRNGVNPGHYFLHEFPGVKNTVRFYKHLARKIAKLKLKFLP